MPNTTRSDASTPVSWSEPSSPEPLEAVDSDWAQDDGGKSVRMNDHSSCFDLSVNLSDDEDVPDGPPRATSTPLPNRSPFFPQPGGSCQYSLESFPVSIGRMPEELMGANEAPQTENEDE